MTFNDLYWNYRQQLSVVDFCHFPECCVWFGDLFEWSVIHIHMAESYERITCGEDDGTVKLLEIVETATELTTINFPKSTEFVKNSRNQGEDLTMCQIVLVVRSSHIHQHSLTCAVLLA